MGCAAATPGSRRAAGSAPGGRPAAAVVDAVTSAPLVSCASTRDCAAYVALNPAVETANEAVRAMINRPRDSSRRCRDMDAATTPDMPPASGRTAPATTRRPRPSRAVAARQDSRAAPSQNSSGARNVE